MRTIARLCLFYLTSLRLQRRITAAGGAVLILALLVRPFSVAHASLAALLGAMLLLLPVLTTTGVVFRAVSAPRAHRFLPYFRVKMLAAVVLTIAIALLAGYSLFWIFQWSAGEWRPIAATFGPAMFCFSVLVLSMFVVSGSPLNFLLALPISYPSIIWLSLGAPGSPANASIDPEFATLTLCALVWVAFGAWYLQARQIAPIGWLRPLSGPDVLYSDPKGETSRDSAVSIYLAGRKTWRPSHRLSGIVLLAAVTIGILWAFGRVRAFELSVSTLVSAPVTIMFFCFVRAQQIAKRSRTLWLRSAELRVGVFRVCETEASRELLWNAALAALLIAGFALLLPSAQWPVLSWTFLLCLVTGLFVTYLGLMYVKGLRLLDAAVAVLLVSSALVAIASIAVEPLNPDAIIAVLAFQIVGALVTRTIAQRRWRNIDWLQVRPARTSSQALRTG